MYISILYTLHFLYYSYITILIVNPPLKIFQIFLRRKIFYIIIDLYFGKKKKKRITAIKIRTMLKISCIDIYVKLTYSIIL